MRVDGTLYTRDPDPTPGDRVRFLAWGADVSTLGGAASRVSAARARAGGDQVRMILAVIPLAAEAYSFGLRIHRQDGGIVMDVPSTPRTRVQAGASDFMTRLVAVLSVADKRRAAAFDALALEGQVVATAVVDGILRVDRDPAVVVNPETGREMPLAATLWHRTCPGCSLPVSETLDGLTVAEHARCGVRS